jgi:hypothetical protein
MHESLIASDAYGQGLRSLRAPAASPVLGPSPDGADLTLSLECRLDKHARSGERHDVTIHRDWRVTTPHDLEAERIAAAFGAYTSCLSLVEETVPALRDAMPWIARATSAAPHRHGKHRWRLPAATHVNGCCRDRTFANLADAISHPYQVSHLTRRWKAPAWQVTAVITAASARWNAWNQERATLLDAGQFVRGADGVESLWALGVRAEDVVELAAPLQLVADPLPVPYFTHARHGRVDLEWVSTVVAGRPDADFATWLVGLGRKFRRTDPQAWRHWLEFGLSLDDVMYAVENAGPPDVVREIAATTGWSLSLAARTWLDWVRVGCRPTLSHFEFIARRGMAHSVPSNTAIERACELVAAHHTDFDASSPEQRTEVAVMLALLGTVAEVVFEVEQGIQTVKQLDSTREETP